MLCNARRGTSSLLFQWAFNWLEARNMEKTGNKGLGSTTQCHTSLHDSALKWWDGWEANRLPFNERSHSCSLLSSKSQAVPPSFLLISASLDRGGCSRWSSQPYFMQTAWGLDGSDLICSLLLAMDSWGWLTWWWPWQKVHLNWEGRKAHGCLWDGIKKTSIFEQAKVLLVFIYGYR